MNIAPSYISYKETNRFSNLVIDYMQEEISLQPYIENFPSPQAIKKQIESNTFLTEKRSVLCNVLSDYYTQINISNETKKNIEWLLKPSTFTICTAHQPTLLTGHLYFIYKIIHAIKLAQECNSLFPAYHFVPVYYMGSEDNDLDEIGNFYYGDKNYRWDTKQTGACGRMLTSEMEEMIQEVCNTLNVSNKDEASLSKIITGAYNGKNTLSQATAILVNALFGKFGLVIIDGDNHRLKQLFSHVIKDELLKQSSKSIVQETLDALIKEYKVQANPRAINLFYLKDHIRERIEKVDNYWQVVNTNITFNEEEILAEVNRYPERFSPNVILRPLYQESILPNIAFVGGGAELAYWLELKKLFQYHSIPYPIIFLRNSVLWINDKTATSIDKMKLSDGQLFLKKDVLFKQLMEQHDVMLQVKKQIASIQHIFDEISLLAVQVSSNLERSMKAHKAKANRIENRVAQKFLSALKEKEEALSRRIDVIQNIILPNGILQERHDNFLRIFKIHGFDMMDILLQHQQAFGKEFLILKDKT